MWFFKKKKKVGLVLGSGGARGLAHVGVIRALLKHKIPIDLIVGSSSGSLFGGLFAAQGRVEDLDRLIEEVTIKDMASILVDPTWGGGIVKGAKTLEFLKKIYNGVKIEDLKIPFAAVATDINTAEPVVFKRGELADAVRASISIPLIYSPVQYEGKILVDGGVSYPVPVEIAKEMGADVIIAVNLDGVYFAEENNKVKASSSTMDILKDSYFALRYNLAKKEIVGADVVIEPKMKYIADFDFIGGKNAISVGEEATEKLMGKIKRLL